MRIRHFIEITFANESFVYGTDRVARVTNNVPGDYKIRKDEATYFLYDHLGNTRVAFTAKNQDSVTIINALDYYSYGKILREYDNGPGDRYLTTGHERDKETGLDYRGARYYDSDLARFLSTDPWADKYPSWSTYNYVMGNPIIFVDPTGKGVDYTKDEALKMAARGADNGYKTEVVENPDKAGDYGVNYKRTVNGKEYEGVQYEGKFEGIVKGGLQKMKSSEASIIPSKTNVEMTVPFGNSQKGAFSIEVSANFIIKNENSNTTIVTDRKGDQLGARVSSDLFEVSMDEQGVAQVDVKMGIFSIGQRRGGETVFTASSSGDVYSSASLVIDHEVGMNGLKKLGNSVLDAVFQSPYSSPIPLPSLIPFLAP